MTMDGRTKPDGTVDFANLDHNDANLPRRDAHAREPADRARTSSPSRSGRPASAGCPATSSSTTDCLETFPLENGPVTPIVINNNLIDFTTKPARPGRPPRGDAAERRPMEGHQRGEDGRGGQADKIEVSSPSHGKVVLPARSPPTATGDQHVRASTRRGTRGPRSSRRCSGPASRQGQRVATNPRSCCRSKAPSTGLRTVARLRSLSSTRRPRTS